MFRVSPNHLLWILAGLIEGEIHNQIIVPDDHKRAAKLEQEDQEERNEEGEPTA